MKKEIEYRFPQYTDLIEISDTSIFNTSISFDDYHSVIMAKDTHHGASILLGVSKVWEGLRYKQYLYYLSSYENEEEQMVHEWYCEGEIPND
ncbi:hypothetical protein CVD28_00360 [Bacillus sp. M6-12]|uniref:hypothetical protein n=1 Tax=Bacillus sp. M6-12 TaxID=2054166 RepID=UPI000C758136|nr:hypothetical protein [Bacillus sp. M6-12]PLS18888.1 hypothetical protein CVD28_00360 [Bacillus sp. M6-12]